MFQRTKMETGCDKSIQITFWNFITSMMAFDSLQPCGHAATSWSSALDAWCAQQNIWICWTEVGVACALVNGSVPEKAPKGNSAETAGCETQAVNTHKLWCA
jgi:hypothetical protein